MRKQCKFNIGDYVVSKFSDESDKEDLPERFQVTFKYDFDGMVEVNNENELIHESEYKLSVDQETTLEITE